MGVAKVKARIYGEDGCEDLDFIVDPNSLETVVPHELAEKIGISMPSKSQIAVRRFMVSPGFRRVPGALVAQRKASIS